MPDIFHDFLINAPVTKVFNGVSTPEGLKTWWTMECSGKPALGEEYTLGFGPEYDWRAVVTEYVPDGTFELELMKSHEDWQGTQVTFHCQEQNGATMLRFSHRGWPVLNEHYRISCYCWAMYLRLLKRYLEYGEAVPYEKRLTV